MALARLGIVTESTLSKYRATHSGSYWRQELDKGSPACAHSADMARLGPILPSVAPQTKVRIWQGEAKVSSEPGAVLSGPVAFSHMSFTLGSILYPSKESLMPRYWWVNQNQTYKAEIGGGYMWSPKTNKDGGFNQFYQNMTEVSSGDIVFSFVDTFIKSVGVVSATARSSEKPKEFGKAGDAWDVDGWLVQVDYEELSNPLKPKEHMEAIAPLLPKRYSPIRADGGGNQVYLAEISERMAELLLSLVGRQLDVTLEEGQEREIQNRTDIGVTQKYQLVLSRVGQGHYRKDLERREGGCRITKITDGRFLTASHIKPWSKSSDFEKLDGNNGLLLSPHVDRLFDRGYISFEDSGAIMFSPSLPPEVILAWGLSAIREERPLTKRQASYMEYHRTNIFRNT